MTSKNTLKSVQGGCLCGQVRYELNGEAQAFHICHCSRCRLHTGTAHASNIFSKPESLTWLSGEKNIKRFELPEAERFSKQFCKECGSPVPHVSRDKQYLLIPAGSLHSDILIAPQDNIFWGSKACWYEEGRDSQKFLEYPE